MRTLRLASLRVSALPAVLFSALLSSLLAGAPALAASGPNALNGPRVRAELSPVEGEVIVKFKAGASVLRQHALAARGASDAAVAAVLDQRAAMLGTRHGRTLKAGQAVGEHMQVVRANGVNAAALAAQLATDADVEYAVPNGRQRILTAPNDPLYAATAPGVRPKGPDSGQWYLRAPAGAVASSINVEAAWLRTLGTPSVVVAVLDTGVRPEHPDLAGRLLPGYDFVTNATVGNDGNGRDADPSDPGDYVTAAEANRGDFTGCSQSDSSWHGTHTAALVGAASNDGIGMAGTAPGVKVLPVRVLGKCFGTDSDIRAGMLWAAGIHVDGVPDNPNPAKVINLSLGGTGTCNAAYQSAVDQIIAKGVVIVAAAGNSAGGPVGVPANCSGVVSVLALRHVGTKVGFSDLGTEITIAAPGGNCVNVTNGSACLYPILAATNTGATVPVASGWTDAYNASVGTSFSAPLVAGTVGLMFSANPALTPALVRSRLQATARAFPTTGGDNGDGTVVQQCRAPSASVEQLQCYCNTTYCGAGMLDAGAAVASAAGAAAAPLAFIAAPASIAAGSTVSLEGASSSRSVVTYQWAIPAASATAARIVGSDLQPTVSVVTARAGVFQVRLTATDALGQQDTSLVQLNAVAVAPVARISGASTVVTGASLTLDGSASTASSGLQIVAYKWSIASNPGGVTLTSADNGPAVTVATSGAVGSSFSIRLEVTDSLGQGNSALLNVSVTQPAAPTPAATTSGGGGGAIGGAWVLAMLLAAWATSAAVRTAPRRP